MPAYPPNAVPIIGLGAVCSAGAGTTAGWERVAGGADGLRALTLLDPGLKEPPLCAEMPDSALEEVDPRFAVNRTAQCAYLAAREALDNHEVAASGLRLGLVVATTVAGITRSERFYRDLLAEPALATRAAEELRYHEPVSLSGLLAAHHGATIALSPSTACSTGLHAIGMAARLVRSGRCDLCLAVGADALSVLTVRGFASLTLLAPDGCRPFDRRRAGISLGEGAGALLLASPTAATRLGAEPLGLFGGWGASADCHHMTAPHPDGHGALSAMSAALDDAGLTPGNVNFVAAHGTATPDNDAAEGRALRTLFGTVPPFCSMKRTIGHTLGASGTLESVFTVMALQKGYVPATGGFEEPDESIGLTPSPGEAMPLTHALKNAFGFGGNNASVVFSRADAYD